MMKNSIWILVTLLALCVPTLASAGDRAERGRVEQPELRHELIHLQHIAPKDAERALLPFLGRWGRLDHNSTLGTLTIVDEPALVEKMLDVLGELDVPRKSWAFRVLLVQARRQGTETELGPLTQFPDVAREIQDLFRFDTFEEVDSCFIKVLDGQESSLRVGGSAGYGVDLIAHARGEERVEVDFHLYLSNTLVDGADATVLRGTVVETSFETAPGQTTIVGASRLDGDDRALITIVETRSDD
jgi:hypothetical protein